MRTLVLAALLGLALTASAQETFHSEQATFHATDTGQPSLAVSDHGWAMLAYHVDEDVVLMSFVHTVLMTSRVGDGIPPMPDPVLISNGSTPKVCWTSQGFVLAMASGDAVIVFRSNIFGEWDLDDPQLFFPGGAVMGLDIWGDPAHGNDVLAMLCIETSSNPPNADFTVHYAELTSAGWSGLETVAQTVYTKPSAQIASVDGLSCVWYRIDSLEPNMEFRIKDEIGWRPPIMVLLLINPVAGEFDVCYDTAGAVDVLGLGEQPACPCGSIHHLHADPDLNWDQPQHMLVYHGPYNWPMSPRLAPGPDGRTHAFWSQLLSGEELDPLRRDLEYRILEDGTWVDAGDFLDEQPGQRLGSEVALAVSPVDDPVLAWTRRDTVGGVPRPQQVWVARAFDTTDVPAVSGRGPTISAHPNPFNPSLVMDISAPTETTVAVAVYDARGARVRSFGSHALTGATLALPWDGRDDHGRFVPSGTYLARAATPEGSASVSLVLVR